MAGPIVHKEFLKQCFSQCKINDCTYNTNIYAQGHDLLLYIQLWNFIKNRNISLILSNYNFREFIYNYLADSFKNDGIYKEENIKMFLYGYISHHILDSYFHPFIMQYAKDYLPVKNKPWLHGKIETLYDAYFISKYSDIPVAESKIYKEFNYNKIEDQHFFSTLEKAITQTYNIKGVSKKFNLAFRQLEIYMYLYRYDPHGFKKNFASITEPIVRLGAANFFYDESNLGELEKFKNEKNDIWINMWSNERFNDSFEDIYSKAMESTINIFEELENLIQKNDIDKKAIKKIIPDRSAITGAKCGKKLEYIRY